MPNPNHFFLCVLCGDEYPAERHRLGYHFCLFCGEQKAREVRHTVAPMNKSNYYYIHATNTAMLAQLNPKRTT